MIVATIMAVILVLFVDDSTVATAVLDGFTVKLLLTVVVVTIAWVSATFLSKPEEKEVLRKFYKLTTPGGPGWKKIVDEAKADNDPIDEDGAKWQMPKQVLLVFIGCITIYASLFSIGGFVYGNLMYGIPLGIVAVIGTVFLFKILNTLKLT